MLNKKVICLGIAGSLIIGSSVFAKKASSISISTMPTTFFSKFMSMAAYNKAIKYKNEVDMVKVNKSSAIDVKSKLENQQTTGSISKIYAESKPNKELEKVIIEYLKVPAEYLDKTKYYYNYVDLNMDGSDEIFVVVMGPYTSGTGGNTALHIIQTPTNGMQVNQEFTLINTPIIISDKVTKGCKEIIVKNSGGGATGNYVVLTARDGQYTSVNEGTAIKGLEGVSGISIINNDIIKDMEEGKALYLK
jgi:hypothetical protein